MRRGLNEAPDEAADEFEGASVDDVGGPVLEAVDAGRAGGRGGGELECRDSDLVGTEVEKGAEGCSRAGGCFGDQFCRDSVDDAHERAEGVVDGPACCLLLLLVERFSGRFGDLAGDDLCRIFLLSGLLFVVDLFVRDLPGGLALSEFHLFFDGFLVCRGELEELIHDEGCGNAGSGAAEDAAKDGWSFGSHIHLVFKDQKGLMLFIGQMCN